MIAKKVRLAANSVKMWLRRWWRLTDKNRLPSVGRLWPVLTDGHAETFRCSLFLGWGHFCWVCSLAGSLQRPWKRASERASEVMRVEEGEKSEGDDTY